MRKKFRFLTVLAVCVMVMSCFSVTALPTPMIPSRTFPSPRQPSRNSSPQSHPRRKSRRVSRLTMRHSLHRDLLYDKATNKQFITVQTKSGNTFFIVIDYDAPINEDEEQYQTYFLNMGR